MDRGFEAAREDGEAGDARERERAGVGVGNALCLASERPADYNASITIQTSILSSPTPQPSRDAHDGREQGDAHPRPSVKELEPRRAITRDACSVQPDQWAVGAVRLRGVAHTECEDELVLLHHKSSGIPGLWQKSNLPSREIPVCVVAVCRPPIPPSFGFHVFFLSFLAGLSREM